MFALLFTACSPAEPVAVADTGLDCAPNTHLEDGVCSLDPIPDEEDSGDAKGDATLEVINHTDSSWQWLWLCTTEACLVGQFLQGMAPGDGERYDLFSGEQYIAAVIDEGGRCDVTSWFSVQAGEARVWDVVAYTGVWPESDVWVWGCSAP